MSDKETLLEEYRKLVSCFDWYYEYSDDHSVWTRGCRQRDNIRDAELKALRGGVDLRDINTVWNKYAPEGCKVNTDV